MTHQQAVAVFPAPLSVVEHRLRDVEDWASFLLGVERVIGTSFGRYTFTVVDGSRTRDVPVVVTVHAGEHRIVWKALAGPRFDGEVRLDAVDDHHTRVRLSLTADPAGFLAGLGDLVRGDSTSTATLDLQRLEEMVLNPRT